jgi:hypothetical protein
MTLQSDSSLATGELTADSESHIGSSSSAGANGAVAFDSSMSAGDHSSFRFEPAASAFEMVLLTPSAENVIDDLGHATPLVSQHYLIPAPDSAYDPSEFAVIAIGPSSDDMVLLDSLKEHFVVLTPIYGPA